MKINKTQLSHGKHALMTSVNLASLHITDAVGLIKKMPEYRQELKRAVKLMEEQAVKTDRAVVRMLRATDEPWFYMDAMDRAQEMVEPRLDAMMIAARAQYMKDGLRRDDIFAELFCAGLLAAMGEEAVCLMRAAVESHKFSSETEADLAVLNPTGIVQSVAKVGGLLLDRMKQKAPTPLMDIPDVKREYFDLCTFIMSKEFIDEMTKFAVKSKKKRLRQIKTLTA